ncbi:MAG TPA: YetF domain-containing protein [Chthonomonadales bacterium]|nr:YetF domain-containing protein [Chthonomonadales bacterium]
MSWDTMLPVVRNTVLIYLLLVLGLRLIGRRMMGQLNVIDLVTVLILGSAVETAMINGNTSLGAGLLCAATLLAMDRLLAVTLFRSRRWRHFINGGPVLLVHDGRIVQENLRRSALSEEDVKEALREREAGDVTQVRFAVMEPDGEIHVVPMDCSAELGAGKQESPGSGRKSQSHGKAH